jgi:hypothetical protein
MTINCLNKNRAREMNPLALATTFSYYRSARYILMFSFI